MRPVKPAPTSLSDEIKEQDTLTNSENIDTTRIKPYPPNFSKMAAKTMDPATGASTWALGSHRCVVNSGNFTINANVSIIQTIRIFIFFGKVIQGKHIFKWPDNE